MMRIEPLSTLSDAARQVLAHRAVARGQESGTVDQLQRALADGYIRAACAFDANGAPCGFAAWRNQYVSWGVTRAQVLMLYLLPDLPDDYGRALVDHVFAAITTSPDLSVFEVRMRDDIPSVRAAWAAHDVVFFDYCRLTRPLGAMPLPVMPLPSRYRLVPLVPELESSVERAALSVHRGGIASVVVPDRSEKSLVWRLRELHSGMLTGVGEWFPAATLVALRGRKVAGYITVARAGDEVTIVDHGVVPMQRRHGLGRVLLLRSLSACLQQGVPVVTVDVTRSNPAYSLYAQVGFQPAMCSEMGFWWRDGRQRAFQR